MSRKRVMVRIDAQIAWKVARDAQSGTYIGVCEPLNINAMGETFGEFQEAANEALALLLQDLFEDNELEAFLRRNGWRVVGELPSRGGRAPRFDVPFSIEQTDMNRLVPAGA